MGWTVSNHAVLPWHTEFCVYLGYIAFWELVKLGNLLCLQSGHNIEKVREKIRELTRHCHVYPPSKVLPMLWRGCDPITTEQGLNVWMPLDTW
jgi:hypothetical protein